MNGFATSPMNYNTYFTPCSAGYACTAFYNNNIGALKYSDSNFIIVSVFLTVFALFTL